MKLVWRTMEVSLEGRVALVTGASSGIGADIALAMGKAGAAVAAVGRNEGRLSETVARIQEAGGKAIAIGVDLSDPEAPQRVVEETIREFGGVDSLVNCAGIFIPASVDDERTVEYFDKQWRVNVHAPFALTVAALPALRERKGNVIFLSSIAGMVGYTNATAYCATKGAIEVLTKALALEEAPKGIRVNAIAPGNVETPMNESERAKTDFYKATCEATPLGRYATPDEIAPMAVFLASDHARFMTGVTVVVDGGWTAR